MIGSPPPEEKELLLTGREIESCHGGKEKKTKNRNF
jgi:hypothetical protein